MISIAIFPCRFTDSARVVGELSYTLSMPAYSDQLILKEMSEQLNTPVDTLQRRLFSWTHQASDTGIKKDLYIQTARSLIKDLLAAETDYIYYGFFTSLIDQPDGLTHRLLIYANEDIRVKRAMQQEKLTEIKARGAIRAHDRKALCWSKFLLDRDPYDPASFDTVVRYEYQDLFDVIAYICIMFENHVQKRALQQYSEVCCG